MAWRPALLAASKTFPACFGKHNMVRRASAKAAHLILEKGPAPEISTLKNGLRVISEGNDLPTTTIGIWMDAGSRHESDKNSGAAHFLEHMLYKGTKNRSPKQLESELESMGARMDSYVSREHLALYVQCASKHVEKVVEILVDLVRNGKMDPAALELERTLIQRQLDQAEDTPEEVMFDYMHNAAFQGTPMARSIFGTSESIRQLQREHIQKYAEANFKPVRMVLSAVGGVKHSQLASLAEKHLGDLSNEYADVIPTTKGIRFTGSEFVYRNDALPYLYGLIAVEGVPFSNVDAVPLKIATQMIGDWDVTQQSNVNAPTLVAQRISHGFGIQRLKSFSLNYKDCGLFGFGIVMDGSNVAKTTTGMKEVIRGWKHLAVSATDEEVDRGKNMYKTQALAALETNASRADDIAKQVLYTNNAVALSDYLRAIDSVDKHAIHEAMNRNVYDRDYVGVGVGRTEAMPDYYQMRIGMSYWRL